MTTKRFNNFEKEIAEFINVNGADATLRIVTQVCDIITDEKKRIHAGSDVVEYWQECSRIVNNAHEQVKRLE